MKAEVSRHIGKTFISAQILVGIQFCKIYIYIYIYNFFSITSHISNPWHYFASHDVDIEVPKMSSRDM